MSQEVIKVLLASGPVGAVLVAGVVMWLRGDIVSGREHRALEKENALLRAKGAEDDAAVRRALEGMLNMSQILGEIRALAQSIDRRRSR